MIAKLVNSNFTMVYRWYYDILWFVNQHFFRAPPCIDNVPIWFANENGVRFLYVFHGVRHVPPVWSLQTQLALCLQFWPRMLPLTWAESTSPLTWAEKDKKSLQSCGRPKFRFPRLHRRTSLTRKRLGLTKQWKRGFRRTSLGLRHFKINKFTIFADQRISFHRCLNYVIHI